MGWEIRKAEFLRAIAAVEQARAPAPGVVFAGRSNVGKSSLINRLSGRKGLARTSNTPGRTREIIYFGIDEKFHFIDLPGYGYAKVAEAERRRWGPMMERFFKRAEGLRLVVMILDVRREPNENDLQMLGWLEARGLPYIFAVTKCDKLSRVRVARRLKELQGRLGLEDDRALVPVSSQTGQGIEDLLGVIWAALEGDAECGRGGAETKK
jgi:GTP-binding protein